MAVKNDCSESISPSAHNNQHNETIEIKIKLLIRVFFLSGADRMIRRMCGGGNKNKKRKKKENEKNVQQYHS